MLAPQHLWMLLLVVTVQSTKIWAQTASTTTTTPGPKTTTANLPTTTTSLAPPSSPPSAPTLDSRTTNSLTISGTATAAVSYMVQHAVVGGVLSDSLTSRTTVLSATINGLTPGQSYGVVVIAYSGDSDVIGIAGPRANFTTKPSPPTGLKATPSNRTVTLDWEYATPGDVVHGFSLQCLPSIDGCSNSIWTSVGDGSTRTYNLNNALYGQEYSFSLNAESGAGTSRDVFSEVDAVSIEIAAGQPTNLTVVERSSTEVNASWVAPVGAVVAGYILYWNSTNSGTYGYKYTTTPSTTVDVLDPGYSLYFSVASTTASGSLSSPSSTVPYTALIPVTLQPSASTRMPIYLGVGIGGGALTVLVTLLALRGKAKLKAFKSQDNIRTPTAIGLESIGGCNTNVDGTAYYSSIPEELVLSIPQDTHNAVYSDIDELQSSPPPEVDPEYANPDELEPQESLCYKEDGFCANATECSTDGNNSSSRQDNISLTTEGVKADIGAYVLDAEEVDIDSSSISEELVLLFPQDTDDSGYSDINQLQSSPPAEVAPEYSRVDTGASCRQDNISLTVEGVNADIGAYVLDVEEADVDSRLEDLDYIEVLETLRGDKKNVCA